MDGIFGRVFGPCFRTFWWQENPTSGNKRIDYIPNRKWRYNDRNLMNELNDHNSWDVMDLADDECVDGKIGSNGKLQLHDNVFVNPLDPAYNNEEEGQEISESKHTEVKLVVPDDNGHEISSENITATKEGNISDSLEREDHSILNVVGGNTPIGIKEIENKEVNDKDTQKLIESENVKDETNEANEEDMALSAGE